MRPIFVLFLGLLLVSPTLSAEGCERASDEENGNQLSQLIEDSRALRNKSYYDHLIRTARRAQTKEELLTAKANYGQCMDQVLTSLRESLKHPQRPSANRVWSRIFKEKTHDLRGTPLDGGSLSTVEGRQPVSKEDFRALMEALTIRLTNACQGLDPGSPPIQRKLGLESAQSAKVELQEAAFRFNELSCGASGSAATDGDSSSEDSSGGSVN